MAGSSSEHRFAVDSMLGRLAKWLRILGHDTFYCPPAARAELAARAAEEGRTVLTQDHRLASSLRRLPTDQGPARAILIHSDHLPEQLRQLRGEVGGLTGPEFSRCLRCNAVLKREHADAVQGQVPDFIRQHYAAFARCPTCERVYWAGTHHRRMKELLGQLALDEASPDPS